MFPKKIYTKTYNVITILVLKGTNIMGFKIEEDDVCNRT